MTFVKQVQATFTAHRDKQIALQQSAYLKNQFPFLGLKKPLVFQLLRPLMRKADFSVDTIRTLWNLPEREYHYAACYLAEKISDFEIFEYMLCHNAWWDTVDWIAATMIGGYFKNRPNAMSIMDQWICDKFMWKRRAALIFQLKWKSATDWESLQRYVLLTAHEQEFFIRKAIGWALRQYSKSEPKLVSDFLKIHGPKLSPLSIREARKLLPI